jgi:NAD(P)-dependent dehydrogenase (short-subunit alcohol dehydrogenase family)
VNNAGVAMGGFLEQLSEDALRRVFEVNVFGSWAMTREALPLLREARGLVVFVSSLSGRMAIPGAGAYVTSKFAMEGMGETWRHELAPHGVRVVLLQPGAIRTPMTTTKLDFVRPAPGDPYAPYAQRVEAWYRANVTDKGADPALVGAAVRDLLTQETPDLRQLVGPRTRLRSLAVRFLPFSAIEAFWARVLRRGAT